MAEVRDSLDELAFLDDGFREEPVEAEPPAPDRRQVMATGHPVQGRMAAINLSLNHANDNV